MREMWRLYLIVAILILLVIGLLWSLIAQHPRVEAAPLPAPTATPFPSPTATSIPEPTPDWRYTPTPDPDFPVGTKVEAGPTPVADPVQRILDEVIRIKTAVEYNSERIYELSQDGKGTSSGPTTTVSAVKTEPTPDRPHLHLSVWEDGNCWAPPDISALNLCGAAAGDGYVVRWIGVHGDSRGPDIPDSDYLAVRGGGDRLIWSGHHPATGEAVTINYWAGGHVLAVHVAGRLLFRIDRLHNVKR